MLNHKKEKSGEDRIMKNAIAIILSVMLILISCASCNADKSRVNIDTSDSGLQETEDINTPNSVDVPKIPSFTYANLGENEWELKRLRLSPGGFEVLDERGRVSRLDDGSFSLSDTSDSFRAAYLEKSNEYLERMIWISLRGILEAGYNETIRGFLEYYGSYYLAMDEDSEVVLYALSDNPGFQGGMPLTEFCKRAWIWYCDVQLPLSPTGGNGLSQ